MQDNTNRLSDLTGPSKVDILREMPVDKEKFLVVDEADVDNVRKSVWRLHQESEKRYMTARTPTGIFVWRLK